MKSLIAYFWPFTGYRDVEHGSMLERAAAWRYNQQLANSLPLYINRWAVSVALALILNTFAPVALLKVLAFILTIAVCGLVHLVSVWLLFKRSDER